MPVTTVANHKGGVGKTMLALLIAAELAQRGRRVLLVDCDPQGNLSRRCGYTKAELAERLSTAEVIRDKSPELLAAATLPCQWEDEFADRIFVVPARKELEQRASEGAGTGSWRRLNAALAQARDIYDDILIDTPPQLGHLLHNALVASDHIIIPTEPELDSIQGVYRLQEFLDSEEEGKALGVTASVAGVIINTFRARVVTHETRAAEIRTTWGPLVWAPPIPLTVRLQDTSEFAEPPQKAGADLTMIASMMGDSYLKAVAA
ncbi:ParA family protein (plasmid) [Streptosporangium sandarakinum]|uniref:ParA family protein n=1 Tax=Streptosporangium sandarakinum TaxID=1260955 RepID=UPI003D93FAB3